MAGDWIKMRASLCSHPKVILIANILAESLEVGKALSTGFNGGLNEIVTLRVTRDVTLASLMRVWCAANEHTVDGVWRGITPDDLDLIAEVPGFGKAMTHAAWAIYDEQESTLTFPNFTEYNTTAKGGRVKSGAERQAEYRRKKKLKSDESDVTSDVTSDAKSDTEKRREEKRSISKDIDKKKVPKKKFKPFECEYVEVTQEFLDKQISELGRAYVINLIKTMDDWCQQKTKNRYVSYEAAFRNWHRKNNQEKKPKSKPLSYKERLMKEFANQESEEIIDVTQE